MKSVPKLIRRFVGIMLLSSLLLIILNFALLGIYTLNQTPNSSPWITAQEVADHLSKNENKYVLTETTALELQNTNVWAILIDNATMKVVWQTDNLPETVPMAYTAPDIASLTRGYIDGYPTFTGEAENGLVVLGYPKDSFWKHMWPSWDYNFIANLPKTVLSVLAINISLIFIIYVIANSKLLKSVKPIVSGIQALSTNEEIHIREEGLLSELAVNINKTSDILQAQSRQLRKRETARANWIAGVSHDIRTPLSMVMGYAGQLESDVQLSENNRQKAAVIVRQSKRMRDLINDLNLASKLEYNMQPISPERQNLIAVVRQVVVDFINMNIDEKYTIEWETDEELTSCTANVDKDLIKRAVSNLIQNSMNHNEQGCNIFIRVVAEDNVCTIVVADDGVGATDEQIEKLNNTPHYMVCDEKTTEQRHGLGLLIVKQIIFVHSGKMLIKHSEYGGFEVDLSLPMSV
ncbi:HAMP domain-containing histidine kinase [Petralouisia muris]|uniref:HAMP domain-containing histidine kinase n=1 Tax=Petralouisia muris TaxID=3032872 RepID=A0AC61RS43_9FIRM|nr:HAMP domain-containing sensor histidine kinase [Petralouisia muris]TGY91625.1 HAMP domain-containing histidine kinase [Petralouisia muris]